MLRTGVYAIVNKVNGKRYVGSAAVNLYRRLYNEHLAKLRRGVHDNEHLQRAWHKYGSAAFVFQILERCSPEDCVRREQYWIDFYKSADGRFGYNKSPTAGSPLGVKRSDEFREKLRQFQLGNRLSEETKEKLRQSQLGNRYRLGKKHTEETKKRMSQAHLGNRYRLGTKHTEETKYKIRQSQIGRRLSEDHKYKLRQAALRRYGDL